MPGALVPATRSSQMAPSTKWDPFGAAHDRGRSRHPEQPSRGITHRHHGVAVLRRPPERPVHECEHLVQRV